MVDLEAHFQQYLKDVQERVIRVVDECHKETVRELLPEIELGFEFIYQNAVDKWYSSYWPRLYRRKGSLYDLMEIDTDIDNTSLEYTFSDSNMTKDRHGGSLFDKVFVHGWHGGAYAGDTISYRRPAPWYWEWGSVAVKTPSAYFLFEKSKKEIEEKYKEKIKAATLDKVRSRISG